MPYLSMLFVVKRENYLDIGHESAPCWWSVYFSIIICGSQGCFPPWQYQFIYKRMYPCPCFIFPYLICHKLDNFYLCIESSLYDFSVVQYELYLFVYTWFFVYQTFVIPGMSWYYKKTRVVDDIFLWLYAAQIPQKSPGSLFFLIHSVNKDYSFH